jgi:hypothetical protein
MYPRHLHPFAELVHSRHWDLPEEPRADEPSFLIWFAKVSPLVEGEPVLEARYRLILERVMHCVI